jgi:hypothetical protein
VYYSARYVRPLVKQTVCRITEFYGIGQYQNPLKLLSRLRNRHPLPKLEAPNHASQLVWSAVHPPAGKKLDKSYCFLETYGKSVASNLRLRSQVRILYMRKIIRLMALLLAVALLPAGISRGQFAEGGYTQVLMQYDRNGNGLLEDHERAVMLTSSKRQEPQPLAAFPLICDGQAAGGTGGATASAEQQGESPLSQVARHIQLRHDPFAENQPSNDSTEPDQDELASTDGYTPAATPAPRQPVQIRTAVLYRMMLNEQQVQPRSQPFAQAATFGPMVGRVRQYPQRSFTITVHGSCSCSRASLYLAGY